MRELAPSFSTVATELKNLGFGKDGKGVIVRHASSTTIGALTSVTAIKQGTPLLLDKDFRIMKSEIHISIWDIPDSRPLLCGIADNELTVAEIAEVIANIGPRDPGDRDEIEISERPVWVLGWMDAGAGGVGTHDAADDGQVSRTFVHKIPWTFYAAIPDGSGTERGWTIWYYNPSGVALASGRGCVEIITHYGVWV